MDDWSFLTADGRVARLLRAADWAPSALGPLTAWPDLLRCTLATMLTSPQPMVLCWGPDLVSLHNDAFEPLLGGRAEGALGRAFPELWADAWADIAPLVERAQAGQGSRFEGAPPAMGRHGAPDGTSRTFSVSPLRDAGGAVRGVLCITADSPARALAERHARAGRGRLAAMLDGLDHRVARADGAHRRIVRGRGARDTRSASPCAPGGPLEEHRLDLAFEPLRDGEARLRTLFEAADGAVVILERLPGKAGSRRDYRCAMLNHAARAILGGADAEGRSARALGPEAEERWFALLDQVLDAGEPRRVERRAGPLGRVVEIHLVPIAGRGPEQLLAVTRNVTKRRRAERALHDADASLERRAGQRVAEPRLLADIVDATEASVQVLDQGFRWLGLNRAAADECERVHGLRPKVGDSLLDLPKDRPGPRNAWARALGGEAFAHTAEVGDVLSDRRHYEARFDALRDREGRVVAAVRIATNVTARIRAATEAQLRQSQRMEAIGQLTGGMAHHFNDLLTPIVGALDVLQRRALGGPRERRLLQGAMQSAERARVLVGRLLDFARRQPLEVGPVDLAPLVEGLRPLVVSTVGPQVRVSVQVGSDLPLAVVDGHRLELAILNLAADARDAMPKGGALTVSAAREEVGPGHPEGLSRGTFLRLWIEGTGQGTGLGLSMAQDLALQLGGAVGVESEPGMGTRVTLWLPAMRRDAAGAGRAPLPAPAPIPRAALLVGDEPTARDATAVMLAELGYRVTPAASADEALHLIEAGLAPDLLVADHLMPGMTGTDLALRLRGMRPGLSVLIVSGFAEAAVLSPDLPRLTKPFRHDELAASLERLRRA